ncbi:GSCFA domain-containing protein [Acidisphaera sp. L21]|uniref:GSCFA domain-containing protein n=1 Tax=Acidisphaera sp. L21 TaxID=1641851 RepID=UPI00131AA52C|nr:GSCFA domain-containing protein [Acidisphaera sp. L21]
MPSDTQAPQPAQPAAGPSRPSNPYRGLPDSAFWSRAVARPEPQDVDPVIRPAFTLGRSDKIATAGSCFAQHIARTLKRANFNYLVVEDGPEERNYGLFSARFANIYTIRQLLQLFQRAYGLFEPAVATWRHDGAYVDPFRPQVEPGGFRSEEALLADRESHLAAVREMFETRDVFIFTLGLTEAWRSTIDGAVYPSAPGVAGGAEHAGDCEFVNFEVEEMVADLKAFLTKFRVLNPAVRVILTVSPVPLIATYEDRHVLVSTTVSKSALRVVADQISRKVENVAYFPSYEIITGAHARYGYYEDDLREVAPRGVDQVMGLFRKHYLSEEASTYAPERPTRAIADRSAEEADLYKVVCEEEAIVQ